MTADCQQTYEAHVLGNYPSAPLTLVRGRGARVWDDAGREYLDFGAGIAVNTLGHAHPHWVRRIAEQADTLVHCSNLYRNPLQGELAEKINERAGAGKVYFCNSGAEANETLLKFARLAGRQITGEEGRRFTVLTAENSFHGRTFGALSATPQEKIQGGFRPLLPGFAHGRLNDLESFASLVDASTAAILIEPIQGESGIWTATPEFLQGLRQLCDDHGLLLMLDEVQAGCGRTGKYFAHEHADIQADAIAMAKGIGGGFPMGAAWISERWASVFQPGSHGTTYGGNPLACAAALAVFETIEAENLLENTTRQSARLHAGIERIAQEAPGKIREIRGIGLMLGLAVEDATTTVNALREKGLITIPAAANTVRLLPPLTISSEDVDEALQIAASVFQN